METENNISNRLLFADAFFLGFTLLGAQIILLREFLLVFSGNELVIGLLLAIWLIITAAGSWSGRFMRTGRNYDNLIRVLFTLLVMYPLAAAFGIEYFRNDLLEPGRMLSLIEVAGYSSLLLFPLCVTGGFLFVLINISAGDTKGKLQNCYAFESLGSLTGGALISLIFIFYLEIDNFKSLEYLIILNLIFFGIHDFRKGKYMESFVFAGITLGLLLFIHEYDLNELAKRKLFNGQELLTSKETAYGNLTVTKTGVQTNFYENGVLLFSTGNVAQREEDVHYAMLQNPGAANVLLIGGGVTGTAEELLKYPAIRQIDYLEMNPAIFILAKEFTPYLTDKRISMIAEDPLRFIKKTDKKYDVVLVNEPTPSGAGLNRFFTVEFYQRLKKLLTPGGLVSTRLTASENYMSDDEVAMQTSVYNSLKISFAHVLAVPGKKLYFIASDSTLKMNYTTLYKKQDLANKYVNDAYLNDDLLQFRADQILSAYTDGSLLNYDFKPSVYLLYIRHWLGFFGWDIRFIPIVVLVLILLFLIIAKPMATAMFTSGFSGAAAEVSLLIAFQVIFGYVYLFLGIIITVFMAGLTIGSLLSKNCRGDNVMKLVKRVQLLSGIFLVALAVMLPLVKGVQHDVLIRWLFSVAMLLVAVLVGYQYGVIVCGSKKNAGRAVASAYSSDLVGSALGSLLVVVYILPVFGLTMTLLLLGGFHFLTLFILTIKRKMKYL